MGGAINSTYGGSSLVILPEKIVRKLFTRFYDESVFRNIFMCILREIYETQMHETFSIQFYYRDVQHIQKLDQYIKNKCLNSENSQFHQKCICYSIAPEGFGPKPSGAMRIGKK